MSTTRFRAALVLGATLAPLLASCSSHSVQLPAVPARAEEAVTWCGPATAQMVMAGYPGGPCPKEQWQAWQSIQAHRVESAWDTDPRGIEGAMEELCPPPGGGWSALAYSDARALMYAVAYWMTRNRYPVAILLDTVAHGSYSSHQEHWATIRGIVTDADPTTQSTVELELVWLVDPAVPLRDPPLERLIAADTWYGELQPVTKAASSFVGRYVAVIEPPEREGIAEAPGDEVRTGRPISSRQAIRAAVRALRRLDLADLPAFRDIVRSRPLEPYLVDSERGGYVLVPFSRDGRQAEHAVLVNAYTGSFQEVGRFAPTRFLSRDQAVERALEFLRKGASAGRVEASLVTSPAAGAVSRYRPAWKVEIDGEIVGIDQDGEVRQGTGGRPSQ